MTKYYVEIYLSDQDDFYTARLQSQWFDSEQDALMWFNNLNSIDSDFEVFLMSSKWENDTYTDIEFVKVLTKEEL